MGAGIEISLASQEKMCLGEEVAEQTLIICDFHIQKAVETEQPLHVTILNPDNEVIFDKAGINEAKFSLTSLTNGAYSFCLEN
jgi:hypothetical protein